MTTQYKTEVNGKELRVTLRQLKNVSSTIDKINKLGGNVGSGHDGTELTELDKGDYSLFLQSYHGGPTWTFRFEKTETHKTAKETPYFECPRCKINSLGEQMCPCPRGSCEAEVVGKVITTVEIVKIPKKKSQAAKSSRLDKIIENLSEL